MEIVRKVIEGSDKQQNESPIDDRILVAAYEASLSIASELDLDIVLQRIVDLGRFLVSARYAAVSITDPEGGIVSFVTSGISSEERSAIGDPPTGKGLLGEMAANQMPLLVDNMAEDRRSCSFPPHHPAMTTLLGVPVHSGMRPFGNLYLSDREDDQPFDERDLQVVQVLAAHAASAVDRAILHRQLEQSRRIAEEQRDQLRVLLESLPTAVLIHSPDGQQVELANSAALEMLLTADADTGRLPVYGEDFALLTEDETVLPISDRPATRALAGDRVTNRQFILERSDGYQTPVLIQAGPLRDTSGEIGKAVVVIQDIARLRESEQLKDDFISLVSHELRTPTTAIYGGAHILKNQRDALGEDDQVDILEDIVNESVRLNQMLTNILSLSLIQAGRLEPATEPVLIESLAQRLADDARRHSTGHHFTFDFPDRLPPIEADPGQFEQMLRNLYENAMKYSPDGSEIHISASSAGSGVEISVTDQGVGIAPEHVADVFERFRRPGAPSTVRGMGLGLYLCRSLAEAQGGSISTHSDGPGTGASFTVNMPIAAGWLSERDDTTL